MLLDVITSRLRQNALGDIGRPGYSRMYTREKNKDKLFVAIETLDPGGSKLNSKEFLGNTEVGGT